MGLHPAILELVHRYGLPRIEGIFQLPPPELQEMLELSSRAFSHPARVELLRRLVTAEGLDCPEGLLGLPGVSGPPFRGPLPWARLRAVLGGTLENLRRGLRVTGPTLNKWIREGVPTHGIRGVAQRFVDGHWGDVRFYYTWRLGRWILEDQYPKDVIRYGVDACTRGITAQEIVSGTEVIEALVVLPWFQGRGPIPREGVEEYRTRGVVAYDLGTLSPPALVTDTSRNEVKFS